MKMNEDLAYFCGLWIAEGSFEESIGRVSITCGDNEVGGVLESGAVFGVRFKKCRSDQWRANSYALMEAMRFLKMPLVKAPKKWLPEWVWSGEREWTAQVLSGMLDGDGCVSTHLSKVAFTTASPQLAKDIQLLLTNFGVMARLSAVESKPTERVKVFSMQYRVEVHGEGVSLLKSILQPRITRKRLALQINPDKLRTRSGLPHMLAHLQSIKTVFPGVKLPKLAASIQVARGGGDVTVRTLSEVLKECQFAEATVGWQAIRKLLHEGHYWDRVTGVEDGECETFDFSIPGTHSFWSDGFITHNTP